MNFFVLAMGFALAFVSSLILTPLVARLAKHNKWVDLPGGQRTVHIKATPRAGGIAVIITFLVGIFFLMYNGAGLSMPLGATSHPFSWALLLGAITIALTGLYDDAYGLGFKKKFLFQLVVAYGMYLAGFRVIVPEISFLDSDPYLQAALGLPLTLLWYLGVMNAVNLVDGLDGLASGVSLISFCSLAAIFALHGDVSLVPLAIAMAGALLGFLVFNFNPASIFLGDTGSLFLGFMVATYALQGTTHVNPVLAVLVMGLCIGYPLVDTTLAFVRRFVKGNSPFAPDKDHIHHRLVHRKRFSTKMSVVTLYLIHGSMAVAAIGLSLVEPVWGLLFATGALGFIALVLRWLGYLKVQRGIRLIKRRLSDEIGDRVPRGSWSGDGAVRSVLEPVPNAPKKIRPEKEDERELVMPSFD